MNQNTYTVEVSIANPKTKRDGTVSSPEKINSRVFDFKGGLTETPITRSVYLNRPMSNGHTKARITVEFLD